MDYSPGDPAHSAVLKSSQNTDLPSIVEPLDYSLPLVSAGDGLLNLQVSKAISEAARTGKIVNLSICIQ